MKLFVLPKTNTMYYIKELMAYLFEEKKPTRPLLCYQNV